MNPHTIPTPPPPTPDWREAAACVDEDPDLWFPTDSHDYDIPRRICDPCPVKAACLDDVMADEGLYLSTAYRYGMWGGLTPSERQTLGRRIRTEAEGNRRKRQEIKHGTIAGARTHVRRGEKPCDECGAARAAYDHARYAARTEAAS